MTSSYQSAMLISCVFTVPRTAGGSSPPDAKAATRVPPSNAVHLRPSSGWLLALPGCPDTLPWLGRPQSEAVNVSVSAKTSH